MENNNTSRVDKKSVLGIERWLLRVIMGAALLILADYAIEYYREGTFDQHGRMTKSIDSLFHESGFTPEELKLAETFENDTLPKLLKEGIVKQLKRGSRGALVVVDAARWKMQSDAIKVEILSGLLANNRVRSFPSWIDVRDSESGKLLAGVSVSGGIELYE